jgi:signal transduction histidine kinase
MGDEVVIDLSDDDRACLRAFGRWLREAPPAFHEEIRILGGRVFKDAAIPWPPAERVDLRDTRGAALESGDWTRYAAELGEMGRLFAEAGVGAGVWYSVLAHYQRTIAAASPAPTRELMQGATLYAALALRVVGAAAAIRQRELLRAAQDETDLYAEVVRQSPGPKLVYEWRRPPDRTSFYLIAANPAARKLAPTIFDSMHQPISDQFPHFPTMELCDRMVETIETNRGTTCVLRPQAGGIFEARVFSIRTNVVGVVYYDIAESMRLQADLAARLAEVEAANSSLDAFAYVASHDLKAPLRDITNLATWIEEDAGAGMPEGSRKHLGQLRDRSARMDRLLDDLLAYSRAGRVRVAHEDTTVRAVVEDAVALAGPREGFDIRAPRTDLALRTPRTPLVQVLRNLVDNALKHHDRPHGTISIEAAEAAGGIRFTVADDGPGIPAAFRERVFQPFTTLKPRDRVEGSGMGLAIVKKLVESHGGRIEIEPGDGRGTRMTFVWPRSAPPGGPT